MAPAAQRAPISKEDRMVFGGLVTMDLGLVDLRDVFSQVNCVRSRKLLLREAIRPSTERNGESSSDNRQIDCEWTLRNRGIGKEGCLVLCTLFPVQAYIDKRVTALETLFERVEKSVPETR